MKRIFTHLFVAVLLMLSSASWAQLSSLEVGQIYRFESARGGRSLRANGFDDVHTKTTDLNDKAQEWYVTKDGDYYVLRNVACGKYLRGAYSYGAAWGMTDDYSSAFNKFQLLTSNSTLNTLKTKDSDGYGHMHDDNNGDNGGYNVVGWLNGDGNSGSHWTITKVDYTAEQITELLEMAPTVAEVASYSTALNALFNDGAGACVAPKLSSLDAAKATSEYQALPTGLKAMVDKVYGDAWAEDNADNTKDGWEAEYAKKFRVQMYEPYSIAGDITSWLGINSHANNDNPTGIYMPAAGTLYVMVEGEIKTGATLRLVDGYTNRRINGTTTESAVELRPGLNVINYTGNTGMLYICYNVDTYNPNGATPTEKFPRKLSEFAPLKIHIEGGAINGFYNACGDFRATTDAENLWKTYTGASVDADADWEYMETRANLSILPILGHREILLLQLEDEQEGPGLRSLLPDRINCPSTPYSYAESWADYGMGCDPSTGKINIVMEAWDRIFYSQLATMGLVSNSQMERMNDFYPRWTKESTPAEMYDYENKSNIDNKTYLEFCQGIDYSEYFNHHGIILGTSSGNPYGAGDHVGYPIGGFSAAVFDLPNTAGSTWGPAHEIGHQHQGLLTLNGLTEVTNNLFSNISLWYKGMSTSRYNGSDGSLESVLNAFNTNGSDIYTNNIWALTHLYYRLWLYYHLAGNNTQFYPRLFELLRNEQMQKGYNVSGDVSTLHFYKLTCQAAGEDLTEFFRAHGYFSVMEDRFVGDYSNSIYNVSQAMIDEAIAEVKAMRDAEGNPLKENLSIIFINDDDENATYLQHDGKTAREIYNETTPNSDLGSVTDFIAGNVPVETTYTATLSDNGTITMSGGTGGVGFLIVNEKGEIISFSNKATFALSDKAMEAIVSGNATIKAVDSQSNVVEAEVNLTALQKGVLGALISKAQSIVDKVDDTYTKIGYFKKAAVAGLESSLEYAKEVYAGSSGYEAAYDLLYAEYAKVLENKDAKIPFNPSLTYIIKNKAYSSETMWVNGSGVVRSEGGVDQTSDDARWKFVETSTAGVYNIRTLSNKYIPAVQQSVSMNATSDKADNDALYTLEEVADGVWAIKLSPAAGYRNLHSSWSNVVGWETGADASRWYLTAVAADPVIADLADLEVYINKTEQLLDEVVGAVTYTKGTPLSLQTTTQNSAGYLWSNAPEDSEGSINYLVDGTTGVNANYFHTEWSSEPPSGSHYLAVYLGEGNDLSSFTFSHTTRSGAEADFPKSVDVYGSDDNVTYKYIGSASGMPQSAGTAWEFGGVMLSSYKYLRFNYHASRGYWHMAEFDITPVTGFTATVNDVYSGTVSVDAVTAAMNALHNGKRTANSISPTTGDIDAKLQALQSVYETLYGQYKATIDARKATLAQLAAETETLMKGVGTVTLAVETPITLTTSNFYCNAPYIATQNADYSADYVTNLTDKKTGTYLHTRWNTNSDDGDYHYLRVDAGETTPIDLFYFTYTTASRSKKDMPLTMVVEGANEIDASNSTKDTFTEIATLTPLPEVLNTNTVYESSVLGSAGTKYRYLRFKVTDITADEDDKNGHPFFTMSEFGLTSVTEENVTVNNAYKSCVTDELLLTTVHITNSSKAVSTNELVTSVPLLDAQIADQQAAYDALYAAIDVTSELKAELQALHDNVVQFYLEIADENNGVIEEYYRTAFTQDDLYALAAAIQNAERVYAVDYAATVEEITAAYEGLNAEYERLMEIKTVDVADRSSLQTLITEMEDLLELTTVDGAVETGNVALQVDSKTSPYYIWTYPRANDDNGNGALIDETDGVANIGTFTGTYWQSSSEAYSHYVEVDLGANIVLEDLAIDYTTRVSGAADSRPTGLKFYGSNDQKDYTELFSVIEGLPSTENTKWEMAAPYELARNYRYIRVAVASNRGGCFNMSDFNLYANSVTTVNEFYSTSDIFDCLPAVLRGYRDAKDAVAVYLTQDAYDAAKTALKAHIDALQAIVDGNVTDKKDLETLVDETEPLVTEAATISTIEEEITMQCTDANAPYYLYCNAEGKDNGGDDALGVSALVGENKDNMSHLHTAYKGNTDDNLDHYLRLDMGEEKALMSFKFSYTGRDNNNNNAPVEMVIEGSNDLENFEAITTLTELPTTAATVTYATDEALTNGKAYRYVRFMVTKTNNNAMYNDHPFFVLSKFSVTACKTVEVNANPNMPLNTLVTAHNEVVEAKAMVAETEHCVTPTAYNTAVYELQAAKNALEAAMLLKNIPVKLTTDVNNPVLYKIWINRGDNKRLQYDAASAMVAVADEYVGNKAQAWFFMSGADATKDVLILPYTGEGKVLATNSFSEGDSKVKVVESTADGYSNNWNIVAIAGSEWSNITILNGSGATFYFSNHGGDSKKMGFYNTTPSTDGGSQFQFVLDETDYSLSDAYYALYNQYVACGSEAASGEVIGTYTVESATPYNDAYNNAAALLEAKNSTDDEYDDACTTLAGAYDALEYNGGLCKIRSAYTGGYSENNLVYVDAVNNPYFGAATDEQLSKYVWEFVPVKGGYHLKSLHTQSYLKAAPWGGQVVLGDEAAAKLVTVDFLDNENGIVRLNVAGGYPLHAQASGSKLVGYTGGLGTASAWYVEKVGNVEEDIKQTVSLGANESGSDTNAYSTLYLAYNAQIPDGITASIVTEINEMGQLVLAEVTGGILPANTAVVLSSETAGAAEFKYTANTPDFNTDNNILKGTSCNKIVHCGNAYNIYMLAKKSGRVAFYWTYENRDENGNKVSVNGTTNHNESGYVLCNANKCYLLEEENTIQPAAMYSFRFGEATTDINEMKEQRAESKEIYDLTGRKVGEITVPGIYVVDGVKRVVR
ncbi:MAG: discoidin domain-containing protein [Bacteroidaceae bacterium]|nr:discoidin domain-containing protein [Bacteroidaceae bacterium]